MPDGSRTASLLRAGNVKHRQPTPGDESRGANASALRTEEMRQLASQLPAAPEQSLASSTVKKYKATFKKRQTWASKQGVTSLPADPLHVSLYLVKKINESRSPALVSGALHSIGWMHQISWHVNPCKAGMIKRVHQAATCHLARACQRKAPLSKVLKKLGKFLMTDKLASLQTTTLITLGFAGCRRWDDLSYFH